MKIKSIFSGPTRVWLVSDNDEKHFSSGLKTPYGSLTKILFFTVELIPLCYTKVKQSLYSPWKFREAEAPGFQDSCHIKVVRSALGTGRLWLPGRIPGTHYC